MSSPKQTVQEILETLPDDASFEDIQYRIYVRQRIERGLDDVENDRTLSHEEVKARVARWLEE